MEVYLATSYGLGIARCIEKKTKPGQRSPAASEVQCAA